MAKSITVAAGITSQSANLTRYYSIFGAIDTPSATESDKISNIRPDGTLSFLTADIESNSVTATSTITVRKNTANGNSSLSIVSSTSGEFQDTTNTDSITAGDNICHQCITGSTGTSMVIGRISYIFEPTDTSLTVTKFGVSQLNAFTTASVTRYMNVNGGGFTPSSSESTSQQKYKKTGTMKYLDVTISGNARTNSTTVVSRKNTANGNLTLSVPATTSGQFEDTSNTDAIAVDDLYNLSFVTGTGTESITFQGISVSFESNVAEAIIPFICCDTSGATASGGTTNYIPITGDAVLRTTDTFQTRLRVGNGTLSNLGVSISSNTTTSTSTCNVNSNGSNTSLSVSIPSSTTGLFEDDTNTASITDNTSVFYRLVAGTTNTISFNKCYSFFTLSPEIPNVAMQVIRFQKDTSSTANATQDVNLNFTPKAIIALSDCNVTDDTFTDHMAAMIGFSDGTNHACTWYGSDDGDATADTGRGHYNDAVISIDSPVNAGTSTTPALIGTAAFSTNKVTFTWSTNTSTQYYIILIAIGGDSITNAKVNTVTDNIGASTTGNVDYTGLGFTGSDNNTVLFTMDALRSTTGSNGAHALQSFGVATSSTKQFAINYSSEDGVTPMDTWRWYSDSHCLSANNINGAISKAASFVAWITDGFRLNWTERSASMTSSDLFSYLVIKGGYWDVGNATTITTTGNQTVNVEVNGNTIKGVGTAMTGANDQTITSTSRMGIGCTDTINTGHIAGADNTGTASSQAADRNSATSRLLAYPGAPPATSSSTTYITDANFVSVGTNQFTVNHTTDNVVTAIPFGYWVLSEVTQTPVMTQVVRFQKDSSGVTDATQDINLNFTPKAIIVFSDGSTANNTVSAHYQWIQGFSDGTNHACKSIVSDDGDAIMQTAQSYRTDAVFAKLFEAMGSPTVDSRASCSFGTNKVTFTWNVNNAEATYITMIAFGGEKITNAKVSTVDVNTTSTGMVNYTGLGFNPTAGQSVLFTTGWAGNTDLNTIGTHATKYFGCAVSSTKQWVLGNVSEEDADPSDTWRIYDNTKCIYAQYSDTGIIAHAADFSTWITDGFQLDWTTAPFASDYKFSYLVIKGGTWDAGTLTSPDSITNDVDTAVSVNSNPLRGLLLAGVGIDSSAVGTATATAIISMGATDGTNQATFGTIDEDDQLTTDSYRINNSINIYRLLTLDGANLETATFDSFSTNNFRLDWSDATSTSDYVGWVVVADAPLTTDYTRPISEPSVTVGADSVARMLGALRPISEPSITVGADTLQRVLDAIREPSETHNISEQLVRVLSAFRTISDPSVTIGADTIQRLYGALRTPSETNNINETLARLLTSFRTINESSISVADNLVALYGALRTISEPSVSINDTVIRLIAAIRTLPESETINETLVRLQQLHKSINEGAVNVTDEVEGLKVYIVSLIEQRIKYYYSLFTHKLEGGAL